MAMAPGTCFPLHKWVTTRKLLLDLDKPAMAVLTKDRDCRVAEAFVRRKKSEVEAEVFVVGIEPKE